MKHAINKWAAMALAVLATSMSACATGSSTSWKEEALLHDGSKIIVERTANRHGRHEIGQRPPISDQSISFMMPVTNQRVVWKDEYSEDVNGANFNLMMLDIVQGTAYLLATPAGCLSYNKWGRPNPPYVIFKYQGSKWQRILLQELPAEIKTPNLIFSDPDNVVKKIDKSLIPANIIQQIIARYRQPEFKTILREVLPKERINAMCMEMILYKGSWIMPNDPVARGMLDRNTK